MIRRDQSTNSLVSDVSLHLFTFGPGKDAVRCAVLGGPRVGKTSLVQAILSKGENATNEGPGRYSQMKATTSNGTNYTLAVMDVPSPGDEDDSYIMMLEGMEILLVCYSLDDKRSLEQVEKTWIPFLIMMKLHGYFAPHSETILVATKVDLKKGKQHLRSSSDPIVTQDQQMTVMSETSLYQPDQGTFLAEELGADAYIEVSAKTGRGMAKLLDEVIAKPVLKGRSSPGSLVKIPQSMSYLFSTQGVPSPFLSSVPLVQNTQEPVLGHVETPPLPTPPPPKKGKGRGKKKKEGKKGGKPKCLLQ